MMMIPIVRSGLCPPWKRSDARQAVESSKAVLDAAHKESALTRMHAAYLDARANQNHFREHAENWILRGGGHT